jgi:hypothetical protein
MILENGGGGGITNLQEAYEGGNEIVTASSDGFVSIVSASEDALHLASLEHAPLNMSGVFSAPANATSLGDIWFAQHALRPEHPSLGDFFENSEGLAGGVPSLWYHAGTSGVVNVRHGSGIIQVFNIPSNNFDENGVIVPFRNTGQVLQDKHFRVKAGSGIRVFADGLYRATYSASIEKTGGNLLQQANTFIYVLDDKGNAWNVIGGESFAQIRDSGDNTQNTANGQVVFDMKAGEWVTLFVKASAAAPAPNQLRVKTRQANMILEFIGPERGTIARQAISPL